MFSRQWRVVFACFACGLLVGAFCTGCNRGPSFPPLARTMGTVTLDGRPLTTGVVVFVPDVDKGPDGPMGIGGIDSQGRYTVYTAKNEGAMVGFHRIRIEDPLGTTRVAPERYSDPTRSGLTAEVKAGEDNVFDFHLTTRP